MKRTFKILFGILVIGGFFVGEIYLKNELSDHLERKVKHLTINKSNDISPSNLNNYKDLDEMFISVMERVKENYKLGFISEITIKFDKESYLFKANVIERNMEHELLIDSKNFNIIVEESDTDDDFFWNNSETEFLPEKMISIGDILQKLSLTPSNSAIEEIEFNRNFKQATWTICKLNGEEIVVDAISGEKLGEYFDD